MDTLIDELKRATKLRPPARPAKRSKTAAAAKRSPDETVKRYRHLNAALTDMSARDEEALYRPERLNAQQRRIFDFVLEQPDACVLIQAGPGTGKSFTLRTIARAFDIKPTVVIFKKDLLAPFSRDAHTCTAAKFFMGFLGIEFFEWRGLERQICARMSGIEYIAALVGLLGNGSCSVPVPSRVVIFDEYTVIPTSLLTIAIMYLRHHGIGVILCGDRDQLQTIYNSHNTNVSSYDIGRHFADRVFTLTVNERCADPEHNRVIEFMSRYSSDRRLGRWAFALVAALFPFKLLSQPRFEDIHLAATHRELTRTIHRVVTREQLPCKFYYIDPSGVRDKSRVRGVFMSDGTIEPQIVTQYRTAGSERERESGQFLPYLPLKIDSLYYVDEHREHTIARLVSMSADEVRLQQGTEEIVRQVGHCNKVIFERHLEALQESCAGTLVNFPLYPFNIMSVYKAQGCTISGHVSVTMSPSMTYQGMYVAFSRVKSPTQLRHIALDNLVSLLVSAIVNVPRFLAIETVATAAAAEVPRRKPTIEDVASSLENNYVYYAVANGRAYEEDIGCFLAARTRDECEHHRRAIMIRAQREHNQEILQPPLPSGGGGGGSFDTNNLENHNVRALELFLQNSTVFGALASLRNVHDRCVWLHEYMLLDMPLRSLPNTMTFEQGGSLSCPSNERPSTIDEIVCSRAWGTPRGGDNFGSTLVGLARLDLVYSLSSSTLRYIEKWSSLKSRKEEPEAKQQQQQPNDSEEAVAILENEEYRLYAETPFQRRVYEKLCHRDGMSKVWLLEQLREMLLSNETSTSFDPEASSSSAGKKRKASVETQ